MSNDLLTERQARFVYAFIIAAILFVAFLDNPATY